MARKGNGLALEQEREALLATQNQIAKVSSAREEQLLSDDEAAIDRLDVELGTLGRLAKRHGDRIRLLEVHAEQEERERIAKRKQGLITRIERKLSESDVLASEIQTLVARLDRVFRQVIALRSETLAAWPWSTTDQDACLLTPAAVRTALQHEIYRQGSRPFVGGHEFEPVSVSLPGGRAPDLLTRQPELVTPLVDALRQANTFASRVMRGEIVATPVVPDVTDEDGEGAATQCLTIFQSTP